MLNSLSLPLLSSGDYIEGKSYTVSDLKSRFVGFNLLVFVPHVSVFEFEGSRRLSYERTKLSSDGGGNAIFLRTLTGEERKGRATSNGIKSAVEETNDRKSRMFGYGRTRGPQGRLRPGGGLEFASGIVRASGSYDGSESPPRAGSTFKPDSYNHEGPISRFEFRNIVQVSFALSPQGVGTAESATMCAFESRSPIQTKPEDPRVARRRNVVQPGTIGLMTQKGMSQGQANGWCDPRSPRPLIQTHLCRMIPFGASQFAFFTLMSSCSAYDSSAFHPLTYKYVIKPHVEMRVRAVASGQHWSYLCQRRNRKHSMACRVSVSRTRLRVNVISTQVHHTNL